MNARAAVLLSYRNDISTALGCSRRMVNPQPTMPSLYDVPFGRLEFIWLADLYACGRHQWPALVLGRHIR